MIQKKLRDYYKFFRNEFGCRRDVGSEYFSCKDINKMVKRFGILVSNLHSKMSLKQIL